MWVPVQRSVAGIGAPLHVRLAHGFRELPLLVSRICPEILQLLLNWRYASSNKQYRYHPYFSDNTMNVWVSAKELLTWMLSSSYLPVSLDNRTAYSRGEQLELSDSHLGRTSH